MMRWYPNRRLKNITSVRDCGVGYITTIDRSNMDKVMKADKLTRK
jgi:hypothetical protein